MIQFYPLTVTDVHKTIREAVVVTLTPAPQDAHAFAFTQGQYLTLHKRLEGEELRRCYSICAGTGEGVLQVGIKKVAGGAFSTFANERLKVGDRLEAMAPMGAFFTPLEPSAHNHYIAFAAGSGITPILSILKTTLAVEPRSRFTLVYANRAASTIMFREELEDIKNQHTGRFNLIHILKTNAGEMDLFAGRLTENKCADLFAHWIDIETVDTAFICGPSAMMDAIAAALKTAGLDDAAIKFELFASQNERRAARTSPADHPVEGRGTRLTITLDGTTHEIATDEATSLLEAALKNTIDAPYACRAGVCSTCRCRVIEGEVEMRANHALEDDEVEKGYVLSCQAYPVSDRVVATYDV